MTTGKDLLVMSEPVRCVAGHVQISLQLLRRLERERCEDRASEVYAPTGKRTTGCVCGRHGGVVPIAPLLLEEP